MAPSKTFQMKTLTKFICILILVLALVLPAQAARLFTTGFEIGDLTPGVEFDSTSGTSGSISATTVRSGGASLKYLNSYGYTVAKTAAASTGRTYYYRIYVNLVTPPDKLLVCAVGADNALANGWELQLTTSGALQLCRCSDDLAIGSPTAALSAGWHRIDVSYVYTTGAVAFYLDGSAIASGTANVAAAVNSLQLGFVNDGKGTISIGEMYFDDIAINDDTGSYQNTFPPDGKVIMLVPNAAGDVNEWNNQADGAGATTDWGLVNSLDDNTTFLKSIVADAEDLFNCTDSGINSYDTVNVVHVGARFKLLSGTTGFKVEVEKAASGTILQSAEIFSPGGGWYTNAIASPWTYPITMYLDPDNSVAWHQGTLDSMQIGVRATTASAGNSSAITTLWAMVDYTPGTASPSQTGTVTGTLTPVTGSIVGIRKVTGTLAGTLVPVTGSMSGVKGLGGSITGTLPPVTGTLAGVRKVTGATAGILAPITGTLAGTKKSSGNINGTLTQLIGSIAGNNSSSGTSYYIDGRNGDDTNGDGSYGNPWQSFAATRTITPTAGTKFCYLDGTIITDPTLTGHLNVIELHNASGTADFPITFTSYKMVDGSPVSPGDTNNKPIFLVKNTVTHYSTIGWTQVGSTGVWYYPGTFAYEDSVYEDAVLLSPASANTCLDGNCFWDDTFSPHRLYYKPTSGTPAAHLVSIENWSNGYAFDATGADGSSYITWDHIDFRWSCFGAKALTANMRNWTVQYCDFYGRGLFFDNHSYSFSNVTIQKCNYDYCTTPYGPSSAFGGSIACEGGSGTAQCFSNLNILDNKITHNCTDPLTGAISAMGLDSDCIAIQNIYNSSIIGNEMSGNIGEGNGSASVNGGITVYSGGGDVTITGMASYNSGASIECTFTQAGGDTPLSTGNYVSIGNCNLTAANGIRWQITVIDSSHFTIPVAWPGGTFSDCDARQEPKFPQTGNVIAKNYVHDLTGYVDHGIIGTMGTGSVFAATDRQFWIYDNIVARCTNTVDSTLVTGIYASGNQSASTSGVINNVITGVAHGIWISGGNWKIKNNIISTVSTDYMRYALGSYPVTNDIDYNCYDSAGSSTKFWWGPGPTQAETASQWHSSAESGAHSITGSPAFTNAGDAADFQIPVTSPCKGGGTSTGRPTTDYADNIWVTDDIGAWAYLTSGPGGTVTGTLAALTGTLTGHHGASGTISGTMSAATGSLAGKHGASGTISGILAAVTGALSESGAAMTGSLAGSLPAVTGSLAGKRIVTGGISGQLSPLTGTLSGRHGATGTIIGVLAKLTGWLTDHLGNNGRMHLGLGLGL